MRKLAKTKQVNTYIDEASILNKYLHFVDETSEYKKYYIMKVESIDSNMYSIKYMTSQCCYFCVPKKYDGKYNNGRCYAYDNQKVININYHDIQLYEMSFDEYIETFRTFVKLDGCMVTELPVKIIQDYVN